MSTEKVFLGCLEQAQPGCKTWPFGVTSFLRDLGFHNLTGLDYVDTRPVLVLIMCALKELYNGKWHDKLVSDHAVRGREEGGSKLRTYRKFKKEYATEQYVSVVNQKKYRSAYAKFRCSVAPIKIETGRYGLQREPLISGYVKLVMLWRTNFMLSWNAPCMMTSARSVLITYCITFNSIFYAYYRRTIFPSYV